MSYLQIRDVHKSFEGVAVLRGMSLDVDLHQVIALVGASGSGKSTLLRCIDGLITVDAGTIHLGGPDGIEITSPDVHVDQLRQKVGIVFQSGVPVSGGVSRP